MQPRPAEPAAWTKTSGASRRRVLITNDDGIAAPGLRALARAAADSGFDVVVAAPAEDASGASAAMSAYTEDGRVMVASHQLAGLDGIPAYGVTASPSYIVVLATLGSFGAAPDVVLSGINRGANTGRAVLHSGTVGAAFTAAEYGRPAMAVSLDLLSHLSATSGGNALAELDETDDEVRNWPTAADYVQKLLPRLDELPTGSVLNLNVPDRPAGEVLGLRQATLARVGQTQMAVAESGEGFVRIAVEEIRNRAEEGTDLAWLTEGYATVTAVNPLLEVEGLDL